jgi:hypothetical protein
MRKETSRSGRIEYRRRMTKETRRMTGQSRMVIVNISQGSGSVNPN